MADYHRLASFKDSLSKAENSDVIVYPNPSSGTINVASVINDAITRIIISDVMGRQVYVKNFENTNAEIEMDISFLQQGNYFVTVYTLNNKYNKKLIIVK